MTRVILYDRTRHEAAELLAVEPGMAESFTAQTKRAAESIASAGAFVCQAGAARLRRRTHVLVGPGSFQGS
jgi:hypothetical protein